MGKPEYDPRPCPKCGGWMLFSFGYGWDYDEWYCPKALHTGCGYSEVLDTITYPDEMEGVREEN